jgi:hypothetical protein
MFMFLFFPIIPEGLRIAPNIMKRIIKAIKAYLKRMWNYLFGSQEHKETAESPSSSPHSSSSSIPTAKMSAEAGAATPKDIQALLQLTRSHIEDGQGKEALETLIRAIIANTGEASVIPILQQMNANMSKQREAQIRKQIAEICRNLVENESILGSELGDEQILLDAFQDGSSVVCSKCQGLISLDRAEKHAKYWCPMADTIMEEDDEEDEDA